jgi:hypothetical protein
MLGFKDSLPWFWALSQKFDPEVVGILGCESGGDNVGWLVAVADDVGWLSGNLLG